MTITDDPYQYHYLTFNGTVLYEEDYVLACSNCSTSSRSNMPDVLTTPVLTIVTSITAGIVLSKKIYK